MSARLPQQLNASLSLSFCLCLFFLVFNTSFRKVYLYASACSCRQGSIRSTLVRSKLYATRRQSEVNLKKELNMQAEVKRAEIALVQRVLHRSKIAKFIQTKAGPPLCWLPRKHSAATQTLLEQEQVKLEAFKVCCVLWHLHCLLPCVSAEGSANSSCSMKYVFHRQHASLASIGIRLKG